MLERIHGNGVRTIIVETANRFARDLIVQETGHRMLRELGIELSAADSPDSFMDDTPTAVMVRQNEYKHCICRPVSAQFLDDATIALFETDGDEVSIVQERHYRLTPASEITVAELKQYGTS